MPEASFSFSRLRLDIHPVGTEFLITAFITHPAESCRQDLFVDIDTFIKNDRRIDILPTGYFPDLDHLATQLDQHR